MVGRGLRAAGSAGLATLLLAVALSAPPASAEAASAVRIIHLPSFPVAGAIEAGEGPVPLDGVAATSADLECGADAEAWPCGRAARTALQRFVRRRAVECRFPSGDAEPPAGDPSPARCTVAGSDIGAWLVAQGWAKAAGERYRAAEAEAREAGRGIWSRSRPHPVSLAMPAGPLPEVPDGVAVLAEVSLSTQTMTLIHKGEIVGRWPVSTARYGKVTPTGAWKAQWLSRNHRSSLYGNAPMPFSVFFNGDYAVHGTDAVARLGQPASAGCVRLSPDHAKTLFDLARLEGLENTVVVVRE